MSAIAIYPPEATDPEIVYLQGNPHAATSVPDLSSIDSLTTAIPSACPPPIPRKSSRRGLRLSIVPETEPIEAAESSPGTSAESPDSPRELPSASSVTTYSSSDRDALDRAIKHLEDSHNGGARPPSYSSMDDAPSVPERAPSRAHRASSTASSTSSARYSDVPPEYHVIPPSSHPLDGAKVLTLTAAEKEALKASFKDDEADAELQREESIYSMNMTDQLPEPISEPGAKTLRIHAKGLHPIRLPLPSKELSILITNLDETLAYTSTRAKRSSANFTLSTPEGEEVLRTSFDRQTAITLLRSGLPASLPFTICGKGFRRFQTFSLPDSDREFEWRYVSVRNSRGRKEDRLVLVERPTTQAPPARTNSEASEDPSEKFSFTPKSDSAKLLKRGANMKRSLSSSTASGILAAARATAPKPKARVLARLVRDDDAFTQHVKGSKGYARAGEGGDLVMEPGCAEVLPEEVVVATALVMLKKEQDRLRAVQAAVIVAAIL